MLTLKPKCTALNFKNIEKTKDNFTLLLYGAIEKELIDDEITRNQDIVNNGYDSTGQIKDQLNYLIKLKADPYYQNDDLPRGIEKIILQIIESYTFWKSIDEIDSQFFLVQDNYIHNLINVSLTFMVSCELAKLFNNKPGDFSFYNIWQHEVSNIKAAQITSDDELNYITEQFERNEATRDKAIKRFLDFRNKSVAHNANNVGLYWRDFVCTINFIIRAWGLIDEYFSPNCFPRPIILENQLYSPLAPYFTPVSLKEMKENRLKMMNDFFNAASTNLISGKQDKIKPFGNLKVTISLYPETVEA